MHSKTSEKLELCNFLNKNGIIKVKSRFITYDEYYVITMNLSLGFKKIEKKST
jgi:hypothetical protein